METANFLLRPPGCSLPSLQGLAKLVMQVNPKLPNEPIARTMKVLQLSLGDPRSAAEFSSVAQETLTPCFASLHNPKILQTLDSGTYIRLYAHLLRAVLVFLGQVALVTENYHPAIQLQRSHHEAIGSLHLTM